MEILAGLKEYEAGGHGDTVCLHWFSSQKPSVHVVHLPARHRAAVIRVGTVSCVEAESADAAAHACLAAR